MSIFDTPITHKVLIKADRTKVFDAMTTANGLDGWFTKGTSVDLRAGGKIIFRWKDWGPDNITAEAECPIIDVVAPERIVFQWWADHYTTVTMTFEQIQSETLIQLHESGYEDSAEGHQRLIECAVGWGEALTLLKFYVEHGLTY